MSLKPLPSSTVKLLGSAQVITSVSSAVKELVENSIDAGGDCIEVKLENYGLDRLEVRDNGCGISRDDVEVMCQKSYTSKISDFSDLDRLDTYGFRGEALSSLCSVGKVTITTVTAGDDVAKCYTMDASGKIVNSSLSHITKGTIVVVENLFRNLPVRRQLMSTKKRKTEELKRIEGVVKCLAIVQPRIRLTLAHNKFCIWQKNKVHNLRQSLVQAIPPTMVNQLYDLEYQDEEVKIHMMIPRKDCNVHALCYGNLADTFYLFINRRPVRDRQLDKMIQDSIFEYFGHYIPAGKHPMCLVSIELPSHSLDVNLEPNKTKVVIKDMDSLISKLKDLFLSHYIGQVTEELAMARAVGDGGPEETGGGKSANVKRKKPSEKGPKSPRGTPVKLAKFSENEKHDAPIVGTLENDAGGVSKGVEIVVEKRVQSDGDESEREKNIMAFLEGLPVHELFEDDSMEVAQSSVRLSPSSSNGDFLTSSIPASLLEKEEPPFERNLFKTTEEVSEKPSTFETSPEVQPPSNHTLSERLRKESPFRQETGQGPTPLPSSESQSSDYIVACSQECDVSMNTGSSVGNEFPGRDSEVDGVGEGTEIVNADDITLSQWSRGDVVLNGKPILGPGKILGRSNRFVKNDNEVVSQELDRSVSSQMGCKEMSAFTKFAREMRTKIIQKAPGMSFTKVASELASRWRNLQDAEKERYKQIAAEEKAKKIKTEDKNQPKIDLAKLRVKTDLQEADERKVPSPIRRKQYCSTVSMDVSLKTLRESIIRRLESKKTVADSSLIGKSDDGCLAFWKAGSEVYAFGLGRLKESLSFFDNLANLTIPVKVLENNIRILESEIGALSWNTLSCLETSVDISTGTIFVSDDRIIKNGFRIEVFEGHDGKNYQITDVPSQIAYYGTEDLKEVLVAIEQNSFVCNLENCRPLKAVSYIRSETIRQLVQAGSKEELGNLSNVIGYWFTNIRPITNGNCPHHSPVAKLLKTL